jgi:hypothetical protein
VVSYGLAGQCQIGNHRVCLAGSICSCHCHRKKWYAQEQSRRPDQAVGDRRGDGPEQVEAAQAGIAEKVMSMYPTIKYDFTPNDLRTIIHFLENLSDGHSRVKVDSYGDQFLALDGAETPFYLREDDNGTHYVSVVVPL